MTSRSGSLLEKNVAKILALSGFKPKMNQIINGYEIDVFFEYCGQKIAIECKQYERSTLAVRNLIHQWDSKNKEINFDVLLKKSQKAEPNLWIRYCVYKDIRNRGYIIKTALKFGADFRIYDRGVKPGEDHARWVVFPVHEGSTLTWYEFAAKNRVAHSTKKRLLLGIVDSEMDVTYYECRWLRP